MLIAYGYGATISGESKMRPMFNLSLDDNREELPGFQGILDAYKETIPKIYFGDMGSATNPKTGRSYRGDDFYTLIEHVVNRTGPITQERQFYNILLLVIDGDSFDDQATIDEIVEANDKPISIIIVGVGSCGFSSCQKFDADDEPLVHRNGKKMTRDIVQFVKYNDCKTPEEFAKKVLEEVPNQLVQYFLSQNIYPNLR